MNHQITQLLRQVKSTSIVDALGRQFNHRTHIESLLSPTPGKVLFGQAVTMSYLR